MKSFLASPDFLWWALGLTLLAVIAAVLRSNISWTARGITPSAMVASIQAGTGIFKKHWKGWCIAGGIALVIGLIVWASSGTSGTSSWTLSMDTVGEFTGDYWLLPLILGGIFFGLESVKKKWTEVVRWTAATLACIMLAAPIMVWIRDISLPTVTCADASAETRSCVLNVKWSAPVRMSPTESNLIGKHLCTLSGSDDDVEFRRIVDKSGSFWTFRTKKGTVVMQYRMKDACIKGAKSL